MTTYYSKELYSLLVSDLQERMTIWANETRGHNIDSYREEARFQATAAVHLLSTRQIYSLVVAYPEFKTTSIDDVLDWYPRIYKKNIVDKLVQDH